MDTTDDGPLGSGGRPRTERRRDVVVAAGIVAVIVLGLWAGLDLDRDGLRGHDEWSVGTSNWRADTDGDGLADGWEHENDVDPLDADTDADGLDDGAELRARADPLVADTDGDGLDDHAEVRNGTRPDHGDTDEDGALDGAEVRIGTDPLGQDTDGDGAFDGIELRVQADPFAADTDGDGVRDGDESQDLDADCDGDGAHPIVDPDDDDDGITDGAEHALGLLLSDPCDPDTDDDGVLDGAEGATMCIMSPDCDVDGVPDLRETEEGLDPLDPDTYSTGLSDAVVLAFQERGQRASADDDDDGIPDAWESASGLIDWGPFEPSAERPDLLIEYVRVLGPDSGAPEHRGVSYTAAYDAVAAKFEEQAGIRVQWVESRVHLSYEPRPPIIPSADAPYYEQVLTQARHSDNPYVTTVVMNPQQDQSQIVHGGIAPIRGMLASIDVGVYTEVHFRTESNQTIRFEPLWESLIAGGRGSALGGSGIQGAGEEADGTYYIRANTYTVRWTPFWFQSPPTFHLDDGRVINSTHERTVVDQAELASTIMHELGHTLGLCHLELADCIAALPPDHQTRRAESVMYSPGAMDALGFLPGEWEQVREYIACPPQAPVLLVAQEATRAQVIAEKYTVAEHEILNVDTRSCAHSEPVPRDLTPATPAETAPRTSTRYTALSAAESAEARVVEPRPQMTWSDESRAGPLAPWPFVVPLVIAGATAWALNRRWTSS